MRIVAAVLRQADALQILAGATLSTSEAARTLAGDGASAEVEAAAQVALGAAPADPSRIAEAARQEETVPPRAQTQRLPYSGT